MTKMTPMPIYAKNPSKIFFSGASGPISKKLGMKYLWLKYYNVYINHDPEMTLMHLNGGGGGLKKSFKVKVLQEMGSRTEY